MSILAELVVIIVSMNVFGFELFFVVVTRGGPGKADVGFLSSMSAMQFSVLLEQSFRGFVVEYFRVVDGCRHIERIGDLPLSPLFWITGAVAPARAFAPCSSSPEAC